MFSTSDPDEGEAFVAARRFAIPAVEAKGSLLLEDVGVPLPALADLVAGVAKIAANHDVMISVIAHAGDGNTHPLIVYDPADAAMAQRAQQAFGEIMDLAIGLGGTITGEHGVGRLKRPWLAGQLGPEAMELNRRIKAALDPDNILNPGAADLNCSCALYATDLAICRCLLTRSWGTVVPMRHDGYSVSELTGPFPARHRRHLGQPVGDVPGAA